MQALISAALFIALLGGGLFVATLVHWAYELGKKDERREHKLIHQGVVVAAVVKHAEAHRKPVKTDVLPDFPYRVVDDANH